MNIIKIKTDNIHIFRFFTSRLNIKRINLGKKIL
jgi:hypothetical protein